VPGHLVVARSEFDQVRRDAESVFDTAGALPGRVCRIDAAESCWFEDATVAAGDFWPDLRKLALLHGDTCVEILVLEPDPVTYFLSNFGIYSAIRLSVESSADDYWDALTEGPPGWEADALRYRAERWIATGESKAWGLWNDRHVELAAVYSRPVPGLAGWRDALAVRPLDLEEAEAVMALAFRDDVPQQILDALRENWR
jgi:hypothetical protein